VERRFKMNRKYQKSTRVIGKNDHHQRPANPGVVMLTQEADKKVKEKCSEIAEALAKEAIKGNASSTRLLVDLAEGADWVKDPEAVERVLSIVELWKKEPKVNDEIGNMPAGVIAPQDAFSSTGDTACPAYVN
jgi:hypothetical protein